MMNGVMEKVAFVIASSLWKRVSLAQQELGMPRVLLAEHVKELELRRKRKITAIQKSPCCAGISFLRGFLPSHQRGKGMLTPPLTSSPSSYTHHVLQRSAMPPTVQPCELFDLAARNDFRVENTKKRYARSELIGLLK